MSTSSSSPPNTLTETAMNCLSLLDRIDRAYLRGSPIGLAALGATSAYYVAFSYGAGVTFLLLGRERATYVFSNIGNHPALIFLGVPLVPVMLVSLEAYDLEGRLLALWRTKIAPWIKTVRYLGPAMEWVWPTPSREPHLSSQDGLTGTIDNLARNISTGLLLPFLAYAVGIICFKSVTKSHTKRVLLGGLTFLSVKTVVKAYLRQQEYRRQGSRTVLNLESSQP